VFLAPPVRFNPLNGGHETDWRVAVLADAGPGLDAWEQLDALLDQLEPHVSLVSADPGAYQLPPGNKDPVPAYLCTLTE
jgi:hypothetical protein